MKNKYKLTKNKLQQPKERDQENSVRLHYQVYIQEEHSVHPKDIDEIEY